MTTTYSSATLAATGGEPTIKTAKRTRKRPRLSCKVEEAEPDVISDIVARYRRSLMWMSVEHLWADPDELKFLRDSRLYFTIPDLKNSTRTFVWQQAFSEFKHESDHNLSTAGRENLEKRLRRVIAEVIRRSKMAKRKSDVVDEETKPLLPLPDDELIRYYLADLAGAADQQLYAGLAVLTKGTHEYLTQVIVSVDDIPSEALLHSSEKFQEVVSEIQSSDPKAFSALKPSPILSSEFFERARRGKTNIDPLLDPRIIKPATVKLGRKFWEHFADRLKPNVCGPGGVYQAVKKAQTSRIAAPTALATAALTGCFSLATFWYPLAVYTGLLVLRTGLDVYCEDYVSSSRRKPATTRKKSPKKS